MPVPATASPTERWTPRYRPAPPITRSRTGARGRRCATCSRRRSAERATDQPSWTSAGYVGPILPLSAGLSYDAFKSPQVSARDRGRNHDEALRVGRPVPGCRVVASLVTGLGTRAAHRYAETG